MDETLIKIVELVAYLAVMWLAAKIKEVGFEQLISKPVVEKHLATLKAYQPFLVVGLGVGLGFLFQLDITAAVNAVVPFVTTEPSTAHALTGTVLAILAMAAHKTAG